MSDNNLAVKCVAILATDGFEQHELFDVKKEFEHAGVEYKIVSLKKDTIKSWYHNNWGEGLEVDEIVSEADPQKFDALFIPGGVMNPDKLRMDPKAIKFVTHFVERNKPIGAICHGPWVLVETTALKGRKLTSWPSIKTDLINAGANWVDQEVVVDGGLVTSRKPEDIPAFAKILIEEITEGKDFQEYEESSGF